MIPVILSGGSGTRLWPISRTKLPKQFCQIFQNSLQNLTLQRLQQWGSPWVITNKTLKDLTFIGMHKLNLACDQTLLEPTARNTAPAIALITHLLTLKNLGNEVVGIFPADHLIENENSFKAAIELAIIEAQKGFIVTLGIKPNYPATGFGYIHTKNEVRSKATLTNDCSFPVQSFHEKPDLKTAEHFLSQGHYFWNAGIFLFKVSKMQEALQKWKPEMWSIVQTIKPDLSNLDSVFPQLENISIDYAIMEKLNSESLSCIPCEMGWSDVGSWDAVADILNDKTNDQKIEVDSKNNFIYPHQNKKYAFIDTQDLIVVDTNDATLITHKGSSQKVKDVVDILKKTNPTLVNEHPYEERPWGKYEILKDSDNFKSKVVHVAPLQQLSYQSHNHREEHWIITKGAGEVVLDDKVIPVTIGSYIHIPKLSKHRIRCTSKEALEFVEVQIGSYFGEDDITRYQDDYKRL